jgi:hypothetical protein
LSKNQIIKTENLTLKLKKNLAGIKLLSANKILIKDSIQNNFSISDIKNIMPFIGQKLLKKVNAKEIIINNSKIKNLSYVYDKKTKMRSINLILNDKPICISYKFDNNSIFSNILIDALEASVVYEAKSKQLNVKLFVLDNKTISFDGIISNDTLNGIVTIPSIKSGIVTSLKLIENTINSEFYSKDFGISGNISYDINKNRISANKIVFDNGIIVKPFVIEEELKIKSLNVFLKDGKLNISDIDLSPKNFSLGKAYFENVNISQFFNKDLGISGILNGTANFHNNKEEFDITIKTPAFSNIKIPDVAIKGEYSERKITFLATQKVFNKTNKISAQIFISDWLISANSKMKITSNGAFNISDYASSKTAGGLVNYDFEIEGSINKPLISGSLVLKDGVYINKSSGTYLKNGTLNAEIKNNKLIIKKIHIIDDSKSPGNISGEGDVYFNNNDFIVNIDLTFNNLDAIDIVDFEGRIFGKISIKGSINKGIKISGALYSNNAKFDVSNTITRSTMAFELVEKKMPSKKKSQLKFPFQIPVDITFSFNPDLKIFGFGVDSKWAGGAKIYGDLSDLKYNAKITLISGKIKTSVREFKLSNGVIWTDSENPNLTMVDISASKSINHVKVTARFIQNKAGTDVIFSSKPYMSKNDILSYLLFDNKANEISTGEGFALFSAVSALSGNKVLDITAKIKTVLGIDSIELKRATDGENREYDALSVGKKIGKMKISIDQGDAKDTTKAVLDAKITKSTKVSVDLYGKNAPGVGILWNKRY